METLRVYLLGQVRIFNEKSPEPVKATRRVQALLAYLMLYRHRSHSREVLSELFWGDHTQEHARGSLSTTLWRLRHILEPAETMRGAYLVTETAGEIRFNPNSSYWLDVAAFEDWSLHALRQPADAMQEGDAEALKSAVQVYSGELLEGFYADWALRERERLGQLYLNSMVHLMRYYWHCCAYKESLYWGQRVLDLEPWREEIQREMMRLYLADGQRTRALQQYELCRKSLAEELNVAPMAETEALHAVILSGFDALPASNRTAVMSGHEDVLSTLRLVLQSFDETRAHLQRVVQLLEHLGNDLGDDECNAASMSSSQAQKTFGQIPDRM